MLKYSDIPANYLYCFATPLTCPLATTCLRALASQLLKDAPVNQPYVKALSPYYAEKLSSPQNCEFYRNHQPVCFAKGMTHLFDELPHAITHTVRQAVMRCFSCESFYYQCRKGERLISPEEQEQIREVFLEHAPSFTPKFDEYILKEAW